MPVTLFFGAVLLECMLTSNPFSRLIQMYYHAYASDRAFAAVVASLVKTLRNIFYFPFQFHAQVDTLLSTKDIVVSHCLNLSKLGKFIVQLITL